MTADNRGKLNEIWETDVTAMLHIFRESLRRLVPCMEQARIPWREPAAYDDWDTISATLFDVIVVRSIRWALPEEEMKSFNLTKYDTNYSNYSGVSFIEVLRDLPTQRGHLVFHSLVTTKDPFDTIKGRQIDGAGSLVSERVVLVPFSEADFQVRIRLSNMMTRPIKRLSVNL